MLSRVSSTTFALPPSLRLIAASVSALPVAYCGAFHSRLASGGDVQGGAAGVEGGQVHRFGQTRGAILRARKGRAQGQGARKPGDAVRTDWQRNLR